MDDTLSVVLFSGTDDKLDSAATLVTGAAAMGKPTHVFLQYWALDAFQADRITKDHGVSAEAGPEGASAMRHFADREGQHWSELLEQAKAIGTVRITACAQSMEMLHLMRTDLSPLVDDIEGVASFVGAATGQLVFI